MKFRFLVCLTAVLSLVGSVQAQLSRWRLGGPALILDMPGDPHAGGVKWHKAEVYNFLPNSWSAESNDAIVEVSNEYSNIDPEKKANELAIALGDKVTNPVAVKISNCPGLSFNVGNRLGLVLKDEYKVWIVLGTAKTSSGASIVQRCLDSISVERGGSQRWVRRNLGQTKMNAPLPFELSRDQRRDNSEKRNSFELFFDGLEVTSFVETPAEGKRFEYAKTLNDYPNGEKSVPGTENFKVKRTRIKGNGYNGDQFDLEFKRGSKEYFITTLFIGDENRVARMSVVGNPGNAKHKDYANRIMSGLAVSDANFDGLEPRQAGNEGIWIDFPKNLERDNAGGTSFRQYGGYVGNYGVDLRVVEKTPGIADNPEQLMDFMEAKFKGQAKDVKDFETDRSRTSVNGLDAYTLKLKYKSKGSGTLRYGMAILGPDKNYVIEMIGYESQKDLFERILDTATVQIPQPAGWSIMPVGESGISMLAPKSISIKKEASDSGGYDSFVTGIVTEGKVVATVTELHYVGAVPAPGTVLNQLAKILFGAMKIEHRIKEQRPIDIGDAQGVRAYVTASQGGKDIPADMIIVRKGNYLWTLIVFSNPSDSQAVINHYSIINSLR
jgi:hypothetical protein